MSFITQNFKYGDGEITLETGRIARQTSGAVMVRAGGTSILVTVVGIPDTGDEYRSFLPLTVNYQERAYAGGKIPGGFLRREGRPSLRETLTSRLVDRVLRASFPKGFTGEVQVVVTVMSLDDESNPSVLAIIGASAALAISGLPFNGPVAAGWVGYSDGNYLLNPGLKAMEESDLDLVVGGTEHAILMVESDAKELSEEIMLEGILLAHEGMQPAIAAIKALAEEAGNPPWDWTPLEVEEKLVQQIKTLAEERLIQAYAISEKKQRQDQLKAIRNAVITALCTEEENAASKGEVQAVINTIEKTYVRGRLLEGKLRIDGRDSKTVRSITIQVGFLPRTHGSAVFTRGETQAIVAITLGTGRDAQIVDDLSSETTNRFMLHYNFPPYSVGETGFMGGPKRRELGHGFLAKRSLIHLMPTEKEFPYVIRVVSEITESNGSSSMATVCSASVAMMEAGIPFREHVAGIAMGLIKEGDNFVVLTDILGDEDHLGDMDFKVAGTRRGITALQMDIKISGITREIMQQALSQALEGRLHILELMNQAIEKPRVDVSEYAPRFLEFQIDTDKIRDVIGKGGVMIREITDKTGVVIDIADDGTIKIAATDQSAAEEAKRLIDEVIKEVEVGAIYEGKVVKIMDFGAFVSLLPNKDGFLHISQICKHRVEKVSDELKEGQVVKVKVVEIDRQNRVRLTMKDIELESEGSA